MKASPRGASTSAKSAARLSPRYVAYMKPGKLGTACKRPKQPRKTDLEEKHRPGDTMASLTPRALAHNRNELASINAVSYVCRTGNYLSKARQCAWPPTRCDEGRQLDKRQEPFRSRGGGRGSSGQGKLRFCRRHETAVKALIVGVTISKSTPAGKACQTLYWPRLASFGPAGLANFWAVFGPLFSLSSLLFFMCPSPAKTISLSLSLSLSLSSLSLSLSRQT